MWTGEGGLCNLKLVKGVCRFGVREKLAPRYVGPYKILAQRGPVAYRI
jgi:hypothetical protein